MKLGVGAKAGLASGVILVIVYTIIKMITVLAIISSKIFSSVSILRYLTFFLIYIFKIITWWFFEGYYGTLLRHSKLFPIIQNSWVINYDFDVIFILVFLILILLWGILLGKMFQALHNRLPTQTYTQKGLVYAFVVWLFLGIAALILPFIIKDFPATKDYPGHIPNVIVWLFYGFLLGKFYDAFSKQPDAGIFYMIKKVILRRPR